MIRKSVAKLVSLKGSREGEGSWGRGGSWGSLCGLLIACFVATTTGFPIIRIPIGRLLIVNYCYSCYATVI